MTDSKGLYFLSGQLKEYSAQKLDYIVTVILL